MSTNRLQEKECWKVLEVYFHIFMEPQKTADTILQITKDVLKDHEDEISRAFIFSDGPSSQYKNR